MKKTRTKNRRLALEKFETRQLLATLELLPSADAALYEDSAGTIGNGTGQYLFAGRTNQGQNSVRRGLIRFDLQSIPDGAVVNSVALTLNASRINDPSVVSLHRLTSDWTEGPTDPPSSEGQGAAAQNGDAHWLFMWARWPMGQIRRCGAVDR